MSISSKARAKQLQNLLNSVEKANKQDALDYTGGHLNESNLHKPTEYRSHKGWKGSKTATLDLSKQKTSRPRRKTKDGEITDVLTQFALGTDGFLPSVKHRREKLQKHNEWLHEVNGSVDEHTLIEELDNKRFMLNRSQPTRLLKTWAIEDDDEARSHDSKSVPLKHTFQSLYSGATKRDQLKDFRSFESNVLKKHDLLEHRTLSGEQNTLKLEQKLNRNLLMLGAGPETAFHRLQAHGDILHELAESSPIFSGILKRVQVEYDDYVEWLLDSQPTQSHKLRDQIDDLQDRKVSNPAQLQQAKKETDGLEKEGKKLLELNDQLREDIKKEKDRLSKTPAEELYTQRSAVNPDDKSHFDLADQLEDLHATILERMDKLEEMRSRLRQEYVPSNVCQNLEQCLKDTEVEVQKLLKQNEIMGKNIEEMERDISRAVDECDVSDKDKQ